MAWRMVEDMWKIVEILSNGLEVSFKKLLEMKLEMKLAMKLTSVIYHLATVH